MPFLLVKPEPSSQIAERPHGSRAGFVETSGDGGPAYRFDYWLGDDLVGSPPVFLVTARIKDALAALDPPVRFTFVPVRAEASAFFEQSSPGPLGGPGFRGLGARLRRAAVRPTRAGGVPAVPAALIPPR